MLKGKNILIGITGGIAAYKVPFLIRFFKKEGAAVRVVLTPYAKEFVTPLTLSVLSEQPVQSDFYNTTDGIWHSHIENGLWADAMVIAPLTANTMAKMVTGITDNLLLASVLSARCPVFIAPAMDFDMYRHVTTQQNVAKLVQMGYHLIEPTAGELASGLEGKGRMQEPEVIFSELKTFFEDAGDFKGKKVLVSAGSTHEPIDPVRFIGNSSSGLMGIEIAKAFADRGANVNLVLGPTHLSAEGQGIAIHPVQTASEMEQACSTLFAESDITIMAAAVADFTPKHKPSSKIKKEDGLNRIELEPTTDILAGLGAVKKKHQLLIGFALETDNEMANAQSKLQRKNLDLIVLNSLKDKGAGFGITTNKVTIIGRDTKHTELPLMSKRDVARELVNTIKQIMK
ncbi:MAG: bifunctional phosphopantothenoylcysteine decarboxylase/phosphopantothenate--cysteine ligase CoaBC [Bacteroidetes bacterium]|nr:MAG: bifunctional phosphopantothenoylcysteine decarboxylase/phosphopantothenate--cysteine ligase CoaBC [Bacteroidota bacterium]